MADRLCMGCMENYSDEYDICPYCGYAHGMHADKAYQLEPGTVLQNRYVVGRALGSGGFGVTYIGYDMLLQSKTAIKEYLPNELASRKTGEPSVSVYGGGKAEQYNEGLEKFADEAKRLAELRDVPDVVKVHDVFRANNTAYIVMEYLEGETLKARLERDKKLTPEEATEIIIPVLEALTAVHKAGMIHRDVAPDNIFLTKDGRVKLIDFGSARHVAAKSGKSLSVLVKPGYVPPEQYASKGNQGPWTDVYGCAATFYRMITGTAPEDAMDRKQHDTLTLPSSLGVDIDKDKENAVMNALCLKAEDRTQSAAELEAQLGRDMEVKRTHSSSGEDGRWPKGVKALFWSAVAVAALCVVLVCAALLPSGGGHSDDGNKVYVPDVVNTQLEDAEAKITEAELIPQIVGKENDDNIPDGYVLKQSVDSGTQVEKSSQLGITVSKGGEKVDMPDLVGISKDVAESKIADAGLYCEVADGESSVAQDYIYKQEIDEEEEVPKGQRIKLWKSTGMSDYDETQTTSIPDMIGLTWDEAVTAAADNKIYICKSEAEYSDSVPKGQIIAQTTEEGLKAGSETSQGTVVKLTVSRGSKMVKVPDVQYCTKEIAIKLIEEADLQYEIKYEDSLMVAKDHVTRQDPGGGESVSMQTTVTIWLSNGNPELNKENTDTSGGDAGTSDDGGSGNDADPAANGSGSEDTEGDTSGGNGSSDDKLEDILKPTDSEDESDSEDDPSQTDSEDDPSQTDSEDEPDPEEESGRTDSKEKPDSEGTSDQTGSGEKSSSNDTGGDSKDVSDDTMVTVPSVAGMTEGDARSTLLAAGLVQGSVEYRSCESAGDGEVLEQSVEAGSSANKGDTVNLIVCNNKSYTEYRYRFMKSSGYYSAWSEWSEVVPAERNDRQTETRKVYVYEAY